MSSESEAGWRMAMLYGATLAMCDRVTRVAWLHDEFQALVAADASERQEHKNDCPECRAGDFCLASVVITPEKSARHRRMQQLREAMALEARDQQYADWARAHPVLYEMHVDGFCGYWQNLRHRLFVVADHRCQRCGEYKPLEAHHLHYDTLGFEELCDLQALCRDCHEIADEERGAQARYDAGLATYAEKKYGDAAYTMSEDELEEEFDRWLENRDDDY